jgi:DNA-binding NarL/FixJ family response regulator
MVRKALRALLEDRPGWKVVGEAANGHEAIDKAKQLSPDVVIMDINMPELDGIAATRQIGKVVPEAEVLVLSQYDSEQMVRKAMEAGARGYLLKADAGSVGVAVEAVCQHQPFLSPKLPQTRRPSSGEPR